MGKGVGVIVGLGVRVGPPGVIVAVAVGAAAGAAWHAEITNRIPSQTSFFVKVMGAL